jgi:hypothetical protein
MVEIGFDIIVIHRFIHRLILLIILLDKVEVEQSGG